MIFENEKKLLKIIKYAPTILVLSITIFILAISFFENKKKFEKDKEKIRFEYTQRNQEIIKQRVYEVYNYIKREQEYTELELKKTLKEAIDTAYNIADNIYKNNQNKSNDEIKKLIIDALRNVRFNSGRGYYFIYENSGKNVLLPHNKELESKDFWNYQDAKGSYIIRDMTNLLSKNNEAFYEWYWFNPTNPDIQRKKIGLVKNFEQFDWFIGTGEYLEDFEKEIQERVLRNIKEIRFGNNGYIFIINYDSVYLSHIRENYIGQNAIINNDMMETKNNIEKLLEIAKNGEGFHSYIQNKKPDNEQAIEKTSFVKGLDKWSWMIGTGYYEDDMKRAINDKQEDLNQEFKEYLFKTIIFSSILVLLVMIISMYLSRILQNKFKKYKDENNKQQNVIAHQTKLVSLGIMIGQIAHQWRQPLSTISTCASGMKLKKEMNILEDSFLIQGLDQINKSVQYLSTTIDDFRDFYNPTNFNIVDKVINMVDTQYRANEIRIIKSGDNLVLHHSENQLIQVILNLLDYIKNELLKLDLYKERLIFIKTYEKLESIVIEVKDNGEGIPSEIINNIFGAYSSTKEDKKDLEMGLYISKQLIDEMNGEIEISNDNYKFEGKNYRGAIFKITIPLLKRK